ncbi:MAG: AsnC family transcriptional regulator [Candidatus Thorarchaeota archaeon]
MMDSLDKEILTILDQNCRVSYRFIGDKVGISANAVRKRIEGLIEDEIIVKFYLMPRNVMVDANAFFAHVITDGTENMEEFFSSFEHIQEVAHLSKLSYGNRGAYFATGTYQTAHGILNVTNKIRSLPNVLDVQFHPSLNVPGNKITLTSLQKRVLMILKENPRAAISEIASSSGLTPRRVRRVVDELMESNAFHFTVRWNLASKDLIQIFVFIHLKPEVEYEKFLEWWLEENQNETWAILPSATKPLIVIQLVVESLPKANLLLTTLNDSEFTTEIHDYVVYTTRKYPWLGEKLLEELLK